MPVQLTDTHCHIHEAIDHFPGESETRLRWQREGDLTPDAMIKSAVAAGVTRLICVGTTLADSEQAVSFVSTRPETWASIGVHPHEAKDHLHPATQAAFAALADKPKVIAVGESGLDYFYTHSPKSDQEKVLRFQIELALKHQLPMIFHVRQAFADFWRIFDDYHGVNGVVHSFSAGRKELEQILTRNLYVGLNGIMTFTKDSDQLAAAKALPIERLLLETDAPFLTPAPYRGTICEPKHVRVIAEFLAGLRQESLEGLAKISTKNACSLFRL